MQYTVEFTPLARKQLQKLPRKTSERIVDAIELLQDNPPPTGLQETEDQESLQDSHWRLPSDL